MNGPRDLKCSVQPITKWVAPRSGAILRASWRSAARGWCRGPWRAPRSRRTWDARARNRSRSAHPWRETHTHTQRERERERESVRRTHGGLHTHLRKRRPSLSGARSPRAPVACALLRRGLGWPRSWEDWLLAAARASGRVATRKHVYLPNYSIQMSIQFCNNICSPDSVCPFSRVIIVQ